MRKLIILVAIVSMCPAALGAPPEKKPVAVKTKKVMVPPPPPEIPLIMGRDSIEFSTMGMPLDLMSATDLQRVRTRLQQSFDQLTKKATERNATIAEAKTRVEQFEQLYTEGVVSKKDLKTAHKELDEANDSDSDIDQRLADVKSDLARVDKRLKALASKKSAPTASTPKHI